MRRNTLIMATVLLLALMGSWVLWHHHHTLPPLVPSQKTSAANLQEMLQKKGAESLQRNISLSQAELYYRVGVTSWEKGQTEVARISLQKALEVNPQHAQAQKLLDDINKKAPRQ